MAVKGKQNVVEAEADAEDVARRIWLAGVGAYGRIFSEASDRIGKAAGSASELFEQLVVRGEALENAVKEQLEANEATQKVAGVITKVQDFRAEQRKALQARVETIRKAVDETIAPFNPIALARQVEVLSARVAELEAKTSSAKKTSARRPVAAKSGGAKRTKR